MIREGMLRRMRRWFSSQGLDMNRDFLLWAEATDNCVDVRSLDQLACFKNTVSDLLVQRKEEAR